MSIISDKPDNLPSTNALDAYRAEEPAEIRLGGKTLATLVDPPQLGDTLDLMIRLKVTEDCIAQHEDGDEVRYLKARLISAWKPEHPAPVVIGTGGDLWDQAPPEGSIPPE